jgi:hypothetical protein
MTLLTVNALFSQGKRRELFPFTGCREYPDPGMLPGVIRK